VFQHTSSEEMADICIQLDTGGDEQSGHGILKRSNGS